MADKKDSKNIRYVTPYFRVSFPNVFKPKAAFRGNEPTYNIQMLFPKDGKMKADLTELKDLIKQAAKKKFGDKLPGTVKNPFKWPLNDGNEKELDNYKGMIYANAKSKFKPGIIDKDKNEILDASEFYAGCWARATISIYGFEIKDPETHAVISYGVAFGLDNLQKVKDDTSFSGKKNAKDDFDEIEDLDDDETSEDFKDDDGEVDAMNF